MLAVTMKVSECCAMIEITRLNFFTIDSRAMKLPFGVKKLEITKRSVVPALTGW